MNINNEMPKSNRKLVPIQQKSVIVKYMNKRMNRKS